MDKESGCPSETETLLGRVSVAKHWQRILHKHPELEVTFSDPCRAIVLALERPCIVARSRRDSRVYVFYRCSPEGPDIAVIVKYPQGVPGSGFILTAYPTRKPPRGDPVWPKPGNGRERG